MEEIIEDVSSSSTAGNQNHPLDILNHKNKSLKINDRCLMDFETKKLINKNECKIIKIATRQNLSDILQMPSKFSLKDFPKLFVLIIEAENTGFSREISEQFRINVANLKEFLINSLPFRPFLIQLTSKTENVTKIFYKEKGATEFKELSRSVNSENVNNFSSFFLKFMNDGNEILDESLLTYQESDVILRFLTMFKMDEEIFYQIMLKCAALGRTDHLLSLLDAPFIINDKLDSKALNLRSMSFDHQVEISTAASLNENSSNLCFLLEVADFPFPRNCYPNLTADQNLKKIVDDREKFHRYVKEENWDKINTFILNNQHLRIVYDSKNNSALKTAIDCSKIETYYHLKYDKGFREAPNESIEDNFSRFQEGQITELNVNSSLEVSNKSILQLILRSSIYNGGQNKISEGKKAEYWTTIAKCYKEINESKFGSQLINAVAQCDELKIIFDFGSKVINKVDRIAKDEFQGTTYLVRKWIFIGARTENAQDEQQVKGIIAHEFCHYALELVFENDSKPYSRSFTKVAKIYCEIFQQIKKEISSSDGITYEAFEYHEEKQHQELIVTVAEYLTQYHGDDDKISELEEKYKLLFIFYEAFIVPALESLNLKQRIDVRKFNRVSGVLPKILELSYDISNWDPLPKVWKNQINKISTNVPKLLLRNIYQCLFEAHQNLYDTKAIFASAEALKIEENFKNFENILQTYSNFQSSEEKALENFYKKISIKDSKISLFDQDQSPSSSTAIQNTNSQFISSNFYVIVDCPKESIDHLSATISKYPQINFIIIFKNRRESNIEFKEYMWKDLNSESLITLVQNRINFQITSNMALSDLLVQQATKIDFEQAQNIANVIDSQLLYSLIENELVSVNSSFDQEISKVEFFNVIFKHRNIIKTIIERKEKMLGLNEYETLKTLEKLDVIDKDDETIKIQGVITKTEKIEIDDELSAFSGQKIILISDKAGSGKSWMLKNITYKLHELYPERWLTYVDLKQFIDAFKSHIGEFNFVNFMVEKIVKTKAKFEQEIFKKLYENGKVFILFDGFDEISPVCAEKFTNLLESFNFNGGNQLWITTRDYFEVDLQGKLEIVVVYKLDEFTEKYGIDLISLSWIMKDLRDSNVEIDSFDEIISKYQQNFENFKRIAKDLLEKIPKIDHRKIGFPQFYKMIAEIYEDKEGGENILTMLRTYQEYVIKLCKIWTSEKGGIRNDDSIRLQMHGITFMIVHEYFAMKNLFPEMSVYCDLRKKMLAWTDQQICSFGLLRGSGSKFVFSHETFCDYFAAEFMLRIIRNETWEIYNDFFNFFVQTLTEISFVCIRMFINEGITEDSNFWMKNDEYRKFGNKLFNERTKDALLRRIFAESLGNLVTFFISILDNLDYTTTKNILLSNVENIIDVSRDSQIYSNFQDFFVKHLQKNDLENLIKNCNIFHAIAQSSLDSEVAEILVKNIEEKGIENDSIKDILKTEKNGCNLLVSIIISENFDSHKFTKFFMTLQKYLSVNEIWTMICSDNILTLVTSRNDEKILTTAWMTIKEFTEYRMSEKSFLKLLYPDKYNENRTLLFNAVFRNNVKFHKTLWKLLSTTFENKEDLKEFALKKDTKGNNFVHLLVAYGEPSTVAVTFKMLQKYLDPPQYKEILTSKGFEHRNILQKAADRSKNIEVHRVLWKIVRESCETEADFVMILGESDERLNNVIFVAANFTPSEVFEFLIEELEKLENDSMENIRNLLNQKTSYGRNLLQSALSINKSLDMHRSLWKVIRKYFKPEEIVEFIRETDNTRRDLRKIAVKFSTPEIIEFTNENIRFYIN